MKNGGSFQKERVIIFFQSSMEGVLTPETPPVRTPLQWVIGTEHRSSFEKAVFARESNRLIFTVQVVRIGFNSGFKFRFSSS